MQARKSCAVLLILVLLVTSSRPVFVLGQENLTQDTMAQQYYAQEFISVIRQDCTGYPGPEPCYTSLADWQADYGGIDFGGNPSRLCRDGGLRR